MLRKSRSRVAETPLIRLKQFDQSASATPLRKLEGSITSSASTPKSVIGIGNKGGLDRSPGIERILISLTFVVARPDYSEAKIVLAMVSVTSERKKRIWMLMRVSSRLVSPQEESHT
jgi:hypothetical protein